jgi:hypothetical protein
MDMIDCRAVTPARANCELMKRHHSLLAEHGFSGQTRELVNELGISNDHLHRVFPGKEALIERVNQEVFCVVGCRPGKRQWGAAAVSGGREWESNPPKTGSRPLPDLKSGRSTGNASLPYKLACPISPLTPEKGQAARRSAAASRRAGR